MNKFNWIVVNLLVLLFLAGTAVAQNSGVAGQPVDLDEADFDEPSQQQQQPQRQPERQPAPAPVPVAAAPASTAPAARSNVSDIINFEGGSAGGKTTWKTEDLSDEYEAYFNEKMDHDLSGGAGSITYMRITKSNLMFGGGFHSYAVSGESEEVVQDIVGYGTYTTQIKTDKFEVSGGFMMIGFHLEMNERWWFQPQLRVGLGNTYKIQYTVIRTYKQDGFEPLVEEWTDGGSMNGNLSVIVLPITYKAEKFIFGAQLHVVGAKMTTEVTYENREKETFESTISSAVMLSVGVML